MTTVTFDPKNLSREYLGPKDQVKTNRGKSYLYSSNVAASYVPRRLLNISQSTDQARPVEQLFQKYEITTKLLESLKEDILDHVETRIQLAFQQMLLFCNTGLQLAAYNQADTTIGDPISERPLTTITSPGRYAAAHSSTLPALRVIRNDAVLAFGEGSFFWKTWNITFCLPEEVNKKDSLLDRVTKEVQMKQSFRYQLTELINLVALGKLTLKEGFDKFLKNGSLFISRLLRKHPDPTDQYLLKLYASVFQTYSKKLARSDGMLKSMCFAREQFQDKAIEFTFVQAPMHRLLIRDMRALKPVIPNHLKALKFTPQNSPTRFKDQIAKKVTEFNTKKGTQSGTAATYFKLCATTPSVCLEVRYYFSQVVNAEAMAKDLNCVIKVNSSKCLVRKRNPVYLPDRLKTVHKVAFEFIKQKKGSEPQNMDWILLNLLQEVSKNPDLGLKE